MMKVKFKDLSFGLKAFIIIIPLVCVYLLWSVFSLNNVVYLLNDVSREQTDFLIILKDLIISLHGGGLGI